MIVEKQSKRHILFHDYLEEWDLHLHLIVGTHKNYVIDTGLGSKSVEAVFSYLKQTNNTKPVVVINSHYHWDHVWGNHMFQTSEIYAHINCYEKLEEYFEKDVNQNQKYKRGSVIKHLPTVVFDSTLEFKDDKITLFHTPGHTLDSICVYDHQEKVLNIADNVPDSQDEKLPSLECDIQTYKQSLESCMRYPFETCICAHNKVLKRKDIQALIDSL